MTSLSLLFKRALSFVVNAPLGCAGYEIRRIPITKSRPFDWLKGHNVRTVFDIGANEGQFARGILSVFPDIAVYSFEPLNDCYRRLKEKCGNRDNWKAFNFGLGEKQQEIEMFRSSFSPSSSVLQMTRQHKELFPHTAQESREKIKIMRLDDVAKDLLLEKEIFVKLDVQGFEDRVIAGGRETLGLAKVVLSEVSFDKLYEGQCTFHTVYNLLRELGFDFCGIWEQLRNRHNGLPVQGDAIFIRRNCSA